jgi:monovalent cation:H+ antiporter, CPA1 family
MPEATHLGLETIIELLLVVLAVAVLVKHVRVPYTVALVLAGLVIGVLPEISGVVLTPDLILTIFLPVLLFEGAYNLPARRLLHNLAPVALFAVPGVLFSTGVTAGLMHWALGLDWRVAFLFGTLISATDPVAVLALFRQLGAPHQLATIVEGESLFNDGTAFVLFQIVLGSILSGTFSPAEGLLKFAVGVAGALALGGVIGFGGSLLLRAVDDYLLEITATFVAAYGAFVLAERFHFSGVIAVVTAGLWFGNYGSVTSMTPRTNYALSATWEFAGFVANSLIFLLIGLALELEVLAGIWWFVLGAFGATLVGRALGVYALSPLLRGRQWVPRPYRHVLVWGGLRGALSLALVLSLPFTLPDGTPFPDRPLLLGMTFGVVGASLLLQGTTMGPLLRRLGLVAEREEVDEYESMQGQLSAAEAAMHVFASQRDRGEISEVQFERLSAAYRRQQERLARQLAELGVAPDSRTGRRERSAARHAALAEKTAVHGLYQRGAISEETLRALDEEIDTRLEPVADRPDEPV